MYKWRFIPSCSWHQLRYLQRNVHILFSSPRLFVRIVLMSWMALWKANFWSTMYDVWLLMLLFKSVAHLKLPIHKLFIFFVTLEWSSKSMGLFIGSWSRMCLYWFFCIQYHFLPLGCSSVRVRENDFGEALQGAQIWASYRNLFPQVFNACTWMMDVE